MLKKSILGCAMLLAAATAASTNDNRLTREERAEGWKLLFDGRSMKGWMTSKQTKPANGVENGTLNPHQTGGYLLLAEHQYENFVLSLDFKLSPDGNSGVFIRTFPLMPWRDNEIWQNGLEIQVLDSRDAGIHDTGALYDLQGPRVNVLKPVGEWNTMQIRAEGDIISVWVNGDHINRVDLSKFTEPYRRPDGSEHKFPVAFAEHPKRGYLGIQDHGDDVWYKNIKILDLDKE
jgi:hypothetical protein